MVGVSKIRDRRIIPWDSRPLSPRCQDKQQKRLGGNPTPYMSLYMHINKVFLCLNLRLQFVVAVFVLKPKRDSLMNYWKNQTQLTEQQHTYIIHLQTIYLNPKILQSPKTYKKSIQSPGFFSCQIFFWGPSDRSPLSQTFTQEQGTHSLDPGIIPAIPDFPETHFRIPMAFRTVFFCLYENP